MVKSDEEAIRHMMTADGTFQSLRSAIFDGQEWLATGEFEDLLRQLELQKQAHQNDKQQNLRQIEQLRTELAGLDEVVDEKSREFQEIQAKYANKQKLDQRIADLDRTRRMMSNGKEIVALLNQTRSQELEEISNLQQQVATLQAQSEALTAQVQERTERFESLATQISEFRALVESMSPEPVVKKSRK